MDSRSRQRIARFKNNARNADDMRKERSKKFAEDRKMKRAEAGLLRRNLEVSPVDVVKPISVKSKLEKWKTEKMEKERLEKLKARPPFITGKVTHKVGSPFLYQVDHQASSQRMTRSSTKKSQDKSEKNVKSTIPRNFKFKAPAGIVPISLSYSSTKAKVATSKVQNHKSVRNLYDKDERDTSESKNIVERKAANDCNNYLEDEGNKEVQSSSTDNCSLSKNMTDVVEKTIKTLNIADKYNLEKDVKSFRIELDTEISSLQALCEQWTELKDSTNLPEHIHDLIDLAVGQTKLLISKKLVQYRGLIDDCEADPNRVTCSDLQGFWDMVYMQVKDVNSKFGKLQSLKDNNWTEEVVKQKTVVKKKAVPKKQNNNAKTTKSSIKSFIAAARNKATKTVSTPGRSSPQNRKSGGVTASFTPKSQSGKENKCKPKTPAEIRRMSHALMKISSQAKELGTPKSQKSNEALSVEVGDKRYTTSVKFAGQEVQVNGDSPVSKMKVPSTPFIQHNLIDLDDSSESSHKILQESDSNRLETPKRVLSLRRSRRLQKS